MFKKIFILVSFFIVLTSNLYALTLWSGLTDTQAFSTGKKYFMHTGFTLEAVLKTAIFSFNLLTPVIAETEFDAIYLDRIMIPKGTKIIGYASIYKTDDRVQVFFNTFVFPDGTELKFNGMALHTDGSAGIPGKVKKAAYKVPAAVLMGTAGALLPGITGDIAKGLSGEALKELERYTPDYSIEVKKDTPILLYNAQRVEY